MKKPYIILLLFLLSLQITFSQTKKIEGDTVFWYKNNQELLNTLKLNSLEKSTDDFNFRFWNHGQVIEISKNNNGMSGFVTNYIYHYKKSNYDKREIVSNQVTLSSEQAQSIYNIIQNSKILDLQSDNKIENWSNGVDGITYIIEHSDKNTYWFKNYWTPTAQDSIPEALLVENFVNKLSDSLNLGEKYESFKNDLPKKGCYHSGGMVSMCYSSNSLEFGYSGATKLPVGFYTSYSTTYVGKTKVNSGFALQYNFDNGGFYHLNFLASKWKIFVDKSNLSDFINYNYQNRKISIDEIKNKFQNHQIKYGLKIKNNISFGTGLDYLAGNYHKIGGHFYASKWFSKPSINIIATSSIFDNQINYKGEIFKPFYLNHKLLINKISLGLAYEDFMNYKDLYFKIQVTF